MAATKEQIARAIDWCIAYRDLHVRAIAANHPRRVTCYRQDGPDGPDTARMTVTINGVEHDLGRPPPYAFEVMDRLTLEVEEFQGCFACPVDTQWAQ